VNACMECVGRERVKGGKGMESEGRVKGESEGKRRKKGIEERKTSGQRPKQDYHKNKINKQPKK
jgi:hypothetical protein